MLDHLRTEWVMSMKVHLDGLDDEYIGSSDIEDPPPDFLEWNGRMFRKSMECDDEYIQVSYVSMTEQYLHAYSPISTHVTVRLEPVNWPETLAV